VLIAAIEDVSWARCEHCGPHSYAGQLRLLGRNHSSGGTGRWPWCIPQADPFAGGWRSPEGVITDRSAVTGGPVDGVLCIAHDARARETQLPRPAGPRTSRGAASTMTHHCRTAEPSQQAARHALRRRQRRVARVMVNAELVPGTDPHRRAHPLPGGLLRPAAHSQPPGPALRVDQGIALRRRLHRADPWHTTEAARQMPAGR